MTDDTKDKLYEHFEAARPVAKDMLLGGLPMAAATKILFPETSTHLGKYAPMTALVAGTGLSFMDRKLKEHKDHQMNTPSLTKQANLDDRVGANRSQLADLYPTASAAPGQLDPKSLFLNQRRGVDPFSLFQGGQKEGSAPSLVGASLFQGHVKEGNMLGGALLGAAGGAFLGGPEHRIGGALAGAGVGALGGGAMQAVGGLKGVGEKITAARVGLGHGISGGSKTEAGIAARARGFAKGQAQTTAVSEAADVAARNARAQKYLDSKKTGSAPYSYARLALEELQKEGNLSALMTAAAPAAGKLLGGAAIGGVGGFFAGGPNHRFSGALAGAGVGALGGGALHAAGGIKGIQAARAAAVAEGRAAARARGALLSKATPLETDALRTVSPVKQTVIPAPPVSATTVRPRKRVIDATFTEVRPRTYSSPRLLTGPTNQQKLLTGAVEQTPAPAAAAPARAAPLQPSTGSAHATPAASTLPVDPKTGLVALPGGGHASPGVAELLGTPPVVPAMPAAGGNVRKIGPGRLEQQQNLADAYAGPYNASTQRPAFKGSSAPSAIWAAIEELQKEGMAGARVLPTLEHAAASAAHALPHGVPLVHAPGPHGAPSFHDAMMAPVPHVDPLDPYGIGFNRQHHPEPGMAPEEIAFLGLMGAGGLGMGGLGVRHAMKPSPGGAGLKQAAALFEAHDKSNLHSQTAGVALKHIGAREHGAHLSLAAERANAEGTNLVNVLIKHAPETRAQVEKQLTGLLSHKGYGRTRALGRTRSDVESDITRAFQG